MPTYVVVYMEEKEYCYHFSEKNDLDRQRCRSFFMLKYIFSGGDAYEGIKLNINKIMPKGRKEVLK